MVRTILIFCFLSGLFSQLSWAQLYREKEVNVNLLVVENQQLLNILDTIVSFEKKYCTSYSEERVYIIEHDIIDSLNKIVTIRSDYLNEVFSNPLYGVFEHSGHLFFVSQLLENLFNQTDKLMKIELKMINHRYAKRKKIFINDFIFDDSLTKWTYVLRNGNFIFGSKKGQCEGME